MAAALSGAYLPSVTRAQELSKPAAPMAARVKALIPDLEAYIESAMKAYDLPGLAIGIVTGDRLVYAKGFGVRSKAGGAPVDTRTAFQIGSLTKGFLATTMAIMVDRGKVHWDDRVVDLYPAFQFHDPWVTREFRIFDLMAQRSGLRPLVNDVVGLLGYAEQSMIRSLRYVEPVSSFRTTFAYTNMTHVLAGRIVANLAGAPDWNAVAQRELLDPLGMAQTTFTAEAMKAAANRAQGHRWTPDGTIEVPFEPLFPYGFGAAGDINSTLEDMARWVRLQLANGSFEGRRIVSPDSLAYTRLPKVAVEDTVSYAMGWYVARTRNGSIVWHDGDTNSFGAFLGMLPDRDVGVIVLTNEGNRGLPVGIGMWALDRLLDNPAVDYIADTLKQRSPNSHRSKRCSPSLRTRGRSRRLPRSPAASPVPSSARPCCGRRAKRSFWNLRTPAPSLRSRPGTAMSSPSACCRAGGSLPWSQTWATACGASRSSRAAKTASSARSVSPLPPTVRPTNSAEIRNARSMRACTIRLTGEVQIRRK
jgi:CubicO group peptidase (beta-lactamase class C family)